MIDEKWTGKIPEIRPDREGGRLVTIIGEDEELLGSEFHSDRVEITIRRRDGTVSVEVVYTKELE